MVLWVLRAWAEEERGSRVGPILFPAHISESHTQAPLGGEWTGHAMVPVPNTHEEGLSPGQHGTAWRGPLSSETGKEGGAQHFQRTHMCPHMPGTVLAALGLSWGGDVIGLVSQTKQQKPRESQNLLRIT